MSEVTQILDAINQGDPQAGEQLLPLVYEELRKLAAARMARENPGQTLQPTALVHEAWLRLSGDEGVQWENRQHFFGAAAEAMRRILVERARRKNRLRHGGGMRRVELADIDVADEENEEVILLVHEALERLAERDPQAAELIKLRFFAHVPNREASEILGFSERTAKRNWAYARAWLAREILTLRDGERPEVS